MRSLPQVKFSLRRVRSVFIKVCLCGVPAELNTGTQELGAAPRRCVRAWFTAVSDIERLPTPKGGRFFVKSQKGT